MFFISKTTKPKGLIGIEGLIIDRKSLNSESTKTVCLDLDKVLLYVLTEPQESSSAMKQIPALWLTHRIDISLDDNNLDFSILPRPGFSELLVELVRYADPVIYTSLSERYIEQIMLAMSMEQGDPDSDDFDATKEEAASAFMDIYSWSIDQCIRSGQGYMKSLGHFCEYNDININDLWMITDNSELVDFPNRVVSVPTYNGDPNDRTLFQLIDDLFIN